MSWEDSEPIEKKCPCGRGHYVVIGRSDDWGRFEDRWEMHCPHCAVEYGLYESNYNRKGLPTTYRGWIPRALLQQLSAAAVELTEAKKQVTEYAIAQFGKHWNMHFSHKTKKAVWRELAEDGKHYPSLPTFYTHVRQSGLQEELERYFEWPKLSTVVRILQLRGSELQARIGQVQELERLLEEKQSHARKQAVA
jgi:hypothetical protein